MKPFIYDAPAHERGLPGSRFRVRAHRRRGNPKDATDAAVNAWIKTQYENGESATRIAETLCLSAATIYNRLKRIGVSMRPRGRRKGMKDRGPRFRRNADRDKEIIGLYKLGETCRDIAEAYGISTERVAQICRKAGVIRPRGKRKGTQ
jgi:transposase-like protein